MKFITRITAYFRKSSQNSVVLIRNVLQQILKSGTYPLEKRNCP